jgi:hypothetical protein
MISLLAGIVAAAFFWVSVDFVEKVQKDMVSWRQKRKLQAQADALLTQADDAESEE